MDYPPIESVNRQGARVQLVATARGPAQVDLTVPADPRCLVVIGHGAGGDMTAPAVVAVGVALVAAGAAVARLDQPYRVAGRRVPAPAPHLDDALVTVVTQLVSDPALRGSPVVLAGKSSGARVASRTSSALGAVGVVALGFPLTPPGRPDVSRAGELLAAGCPVLVCQGERDVFGSPAAVAAAAGGREDVTVHAVAGGDHSFVARRSDGRTTVQCLAEVSDVVVRWVLAQTATT